MRLLLLYALATEAAWLTHDLDDLMGSSDTLPSLSALSSPATKYLRHLYQFAPLLLWDLHAMLERDEARHLPRFLPLCVSWFDEIGRGGCCREMDREGGKAGATVRSLLPVLKAVSGEERLVVDTSTVPDSEYLNKAHLHFQLRHHKHHKTAYLKKRRHHVIHARATSEGGEVFDLEEVDGGKVVGGGLVFEASPLLEWTRGPFQLSFRRLRRGREQEIPAQRVMRHARPFLLVYTQEYPPDKRVEDFETHNRVKRSSGQYYYAMGGNKQTNVTDPLQLHVQAFMREGPDALDTRKEARRRRKQEAKKRRGRRRHLSDNHIPYPPGWHGEDGEAMTGEEEEEEKNRTPKNGAEVVLLEGERVGGEECNLRPFDLNFRSLGGWYHRIIAPKSLSLGLCNGLCKGPKGLWSNHARLVSMAAGLGVEGTEGVGGGCCAPDKFDSATILFFDRKGSVVLKNFPDLIVKRCACL